MANLFKTLDIKRNEYVEKGDMSALSVLSRLEGYVEGGHYSKYKFANKYYSYRNLSAKDVGELLGVSAESVKRRRNELSSACWNLIGLDFFDKLDSGDYTTCNSILDFIVVDNVGATLLPSGVSSLIESVATAKELKDSKELSELSSYVEEVNFLVSISSPYIKARVSNLDISKLLYAIGVLQGTMGTPTEHANLVNYILERSGDAL